MSWREVLMAILISLALAGIYGIYKGINSVITEWKEEKTEWIFISEALDKSKFYINKERYNRDGEEVTIVSKRILKYPEFATNSSFAKYDEEESIIALDCKNNLVLNTSSRYFENGRFIYGPINSEGFELKPKWVIYEIKEYACQNFKKKKK